VVDILSVAAILPLLYAAYWAFDIGHVLPVRLYRHQAVGLGIFCLVLTIAILPSPIPGASGVLGSFPFEVGYILITAVFWLGILYFVDVSVLASRRSDPLLRDTIRWSKLRYVLWAIQIFLVSFILIGVISTPVTGNNLLLTEIFEGNNGAKGSVPAIIANLVWAVSFGSLIAFIPIAIRAKDPTLRRHFKWLAALAGITGLFFLISGIFPSLLASSEAVTSDPIASAIGTVFFLSVVGYFLYRSARALVPLNRISLE
jgi:hypothetical protein